MGRKAKHWKQYDINELPRTAGGDYDYKQLLDRFELFYDHADEKTLKQAIRKFGRTAQSRVNLLTGKQKKKLSKKQGGGYTTYELAEAVPGWAKGYSTSVAGKSKQQLKYQLMRAFKILSSDWSTVEGARQAKEQYKRRKLQEYQEWNPNITIEMIEDIDFWRMVREIIAAALTTDDSNTAMAIAAFAYETGNIRNWSLKKAIHEYKKKERQEWESYDSMQEDNSTVYDNIADELIENDEIIQALKKGLIK